jgi:FAD/FMN-containing dehydrogenase
VITRAAIPGFAGEVVRPDDPVFDEHREIWNAIVDRRPALIARCTSAEDVAAAIRFGRDAGLTIAVKCGGHSILGLSVPDGGLMIDLTPMSEVRVDPERRRAWVGGGSLLRNLDRTAEPFGLATTAGNVSHTGVGGLTLGGGMGWLARQFGLACDNVERYTVVTADGERVVASATENADLFWGLRGGGGNFGVVTEFEFRLHPFDHRVLVVDRWVGLEEAPAALRAWRSLLAEAPRQATMTADVTTAPADAAYVPPALRGQPVASAGFVWAGDLGEGRRWLETLRSAAGAAAEDVREMRYVELQSIGDDNHRHGRRRYSKGHYLRELTDEAIEAFVSRGVPSGRGPADSSMLPNAGFQAYGGAIADVADDDSAFSHRGTLVEWGCGVAWTDPGEDDERMTLARASAAAIEPFASGVYVNALADEGQAGVRRAYSEAKLERLAALKRNWDPDNVFRLNHNIAPTGSRSSAG